MASNRVYEIVTEKITALVESEQKLPWQYNWKPRGGSIARNAWGKRYRGINVFILAWESMVKGYKSSYWLTFKQITERGGTLRKVAVKNVETGEMEMKSEKSTLIVFWKPLVVDEVKDGVKTGKKKKIMMLRYFLVWNLDQTEGVKFTKAQQAEREANEADKPFDFVEGGEDADDAEAIFSTYFARDDAPEFEEYGGEAYYIPSADKVVMPERGSYKSRAKFFHDAFHEIIHSTGHKSRLNRRGSEIQQAHTGKAAYAYEELVAMFGAAFLSAESGINGEHENDAAYIQGWNSYFKSDPTAIVKAAGAAQKAADYILASGEVNNEPASEEEAA